MSTAAMRKEIVDYILTTPNKKLKAIYTLLEDDMKQESRVTIDQYNKEIDITLAEIKNNKGISQKEMDKLSKNW
jgi:hypothetical protein